MKKLHKFTRSEYELLKASGMFWELYPEATGTFKVDKQLSKEGKFKIER